MIHFAFTDKDKRWLFLKFDNDDDLKVLKDLKKEMNQVDPVCYLKTYTGIPFTQDFLYEYVQKSGKLIFYCSIGLWQTVKEYFDSHEVEYDGLDINRFRTSLLHDFNEFKSIVDSWNLKYQPRPYQYECAWKILNYRRSVSECATRAGKTLIAYLVFRYMREYMGSKRILMIVPSIDLVKQGYNDFKEYGDYFNAECLWSGGKCVESSNLTIATFQTLINFLDTKSKKYNPSFFSGNNIDRLPYDVVFVDETHRATAKSIKTIITQPFVNNLKLMFGMTGTLPKEWTIDRLAINAMLGPKIQELTPAQLQKEGYISKVQIIQHRIKYNNDENVLKDWIRCAEYCLSKFIEVPNKKNPKKKDHVPLDNPEMLIAFKKEMPIGILQAKQNIMSQTLPSTSKMTERDFEQFKMLQYKKVLQELVKASTATNQLHIEMMSVQFKEERIDLLINTLKECPRNTLVLAQHREYIKHVYDRVKEAFPDRNVLYVIGGAKDRKIVKQVLAENNNCILIAGYSIMGTGITLSNLCYGVLFESFKSQVINMQSIGRGLGLSDLKDKYILHDFTDVFDDKIASNKIFLQGLQRKKMYAEQEWPCELTTDYIGDTVHIDNRIIDFVYKKQPKKKKEEKKKKLIENQPLLFTEDEMCG